MKSLPLRKIKVPRDSITHQSASPLNNSPTQVRKSFHAATVPHFPQRPSRYIHARPQGIYLSPCTSPSNPPPRLKPLRHTPFHNPPPPCSPISPHPAIDLRPRQHNAPQPALIPLFSLCTLSSYLTLTFILTQYSIKTSHILKVWTQADIGQDPAHHLCRSGGRSTTALTDANRSNTWELIFQQRNYQSGATRTS